MEVLDEALVSQYYDLRQQLDVMSADFQEIITHPMYALPFLRPGRLVKVKHQKIDFGWGVVINYRKRSSPKVCLLTFRMMTTGLSLLQSNLSSTIPLNEQYIVDVLLSCAQGSAPPRGLSIGGSAIPAGVQPCAVGQSGVPLMLPVLLSTIDGISHICLYLPKDMCQKQAPETVWKSVLEVHCRFPDGVALLDPVKHMGITDVKFRNLIKVCFWCFQQCASGF